jgi:hypothetical protein
LFKVFAKLEPTDEERRLIETYNVDHMTWVELKGEKVPIAALLRGVATESSGFGFIAVHERAIREGCQQLNAHLKALSSFCGETVIEL